MTGFIGEDLVNDHPLWGGISILSPNRPLGSSSTKPRSLVLFYTGNVFIKISGSAHSVSKFLYITRG